MYYQKHVTMQQRSVNQKHYTFIDRILSGWWVQKHKEWICKNIDKAIEKHKEDQA